MTARCPKCGSTKIELTTGDISFITCKHCSYDEHMFDITPTERSQGGKARNPYKAGGARRTQRAAK